jgi:hypothetical protein
VKNRDPHQKTNAPWSWEQRESPPRLAVKSRLLGSRAMLPVGPYRVERSSLAAPRLQRSSPSEANSVSGAARAAPLRRSEFGEASPHAARRVRSSLGAVGPYRVERSSLAAPRLQRSSPSEANPEPLVSFTSTARSRETRWSCLASGPRLARAPRRGTRPRRASHGRGCTGLS